MDNSIIEWVFSKEPNFPFTPDSWTKVIDATTIFLPEWKSPTYNKMLGHKLPANLDINKTTILGGICSIFTAETEQMRKKELIFKDINGFEKWIYSWYPRIDQIHDTVGIPPKLCSKIIYVCEDSLFAKRISVHTGLPKDELQQILKEVHTKQGHPVLCNWLKSFGYSGSIEVVYTSDLQKELKTGVRIWERISGVSFKNKYQEFACVKLMYTAIWLDILGVKDFGVIYEPANHMYQLGIKELGVICGSVDHMYQAHGLKDWFANNKFGVGFNHNLGIIGYLPFWTAKGISRFLPLEQLPHYGNFNTYSISMDNLPWYVINMLFTNKEVLSKSPKLICADNAKYLIKSIFNKYYHLNKDGENKNEKI